MDEPEAEMDEPEGPEAEMDELEGPEAMDEPEAEDLEAADVMPLRRSQRVTRGRAAERLLPPYL